ncbi:MAG: hypothetical protein J0H49_30850 [Acidobacteria bacterium]|nr:hypothetical protein [Acidobacteriota bacterium]
MIQRRLFSFAAALALAAVLGKFYAVPAMAQAVSAMLVRNVDEKGRAPYMHNVIHVCQGDAVCDLYFPAVPAGKRLVVEHVNAGISFAANRLRFTTLVAQGNTQFLLPARPIDDPNLTIVNERVLAFFESGQTPMFRVGLNAATDTTPVNAAISGYLVDLSQY